MPVHRLIFRFDFRINYGILDRPGTVLEIIDGEREGDWTTFGFSQQAHQLQANYSDSELARRFVVQADAMHGLYETTHGVEMQDLLNDPTLKSFSRLIDRVSKEFKIGPIRRAGLRLYYFGQVVEHRADVINKFRRLYHPMVLEKIGSALGEPEDYGFAFNAGLQDKESSSEGYNLQFGPYDPVESSRYFEVLGDEFGAVSENMNFICDLDQFEKKFELPDGIKGRWFNPLIIKANEFISSIEELILRQ